MDLSQAIAELQERLRRPRATNLIYLAFPVAYTPTDPIHKVGAALGADVISVMGLLVQRFGARWERLLAATEPAQLETVAKTLAQDLLAEVGPRSCVLIGDTEVLYALPQLNPTALLYPLSDARLIAVSLKAGRVAAGLRLLEDGPIYPVDNCTVLEVTL